MQRIYNAYEVAEILQVSYRTVLRLIKEGKLKKLDGIPGKTKVSQHQLNEYLKGK
jgi:excisionase family DNA binding protein